MKIVVDEDGHGSEITPVEGRRLEFKDFFGAMEAPQFRDRITDFGDLMPSVMRISGHAT